MTHELERLRRSTAALHGSSAGPLTRQAALRLVDEVMSRRRETAGYRRAVAEVRRVLEGRFGVPSPICNDHLSSIFWLVATSGMGGAEAMGMRGL
jgi:hypothetical protein